MEVLLRDGGGVEVRRLSDGSEIDFDAMDDAIGTETAEGGGQGGSADGGLLLSAAGLPRRSRVVEVAMGVDGRRIEEWRRAAGWPGAGVGLAGLVGRA